MAAVFAKLGSSPASMEAAKILDAFGSQPGYRKAQADAKQAYIQALFKGVPTWLRLPKNRWPSHWSKQYIDPIVPLVLALYGHPDSGGLWEKHLEDALSKQGFVRVLPEIWTSIFHHPELDLLLVVYVDDFKLAGPAGSRSGRLSRSTRPSHSADTLGVITSKRTMSDCLKRNTLSITCLRVLCNTRVFAPKEGLRTTGSMTRTRKRGHTITCSPGSAFSVLRSK